MTASNTPRTGYAPVNGLNMYYDVSYQQSAISSQLSAIR